MKLLAQTKTHNIFGLQKGMGAAIKIVLYKKSRKKKVTIEGKPDYREIIAAPGRDISKTELEQNLGHWEDARNFVELNYMDAVMVNPKNEE